MVSERDKEREINNYLVGARTGLASPKISTTNWHPLWGVAAVTKVGRSIRVENGSVCVAGELKRVEASVGA